MTRAVFISSAPFNLCTNRLRERRHGSRVLLEHNSILNLARLQAHSRNRQVEGSPRIRVSDVVLRSTDSAASQFWRRKHEESIQLVGIC